MAFQTEVFEGQFKITEEGVAELTTALNKLIGVADKVTAKLSNIKITIPKLDTTEAVKSAEAVGKATSEAAAAGKKVKGPDLAAIEAAIQKVDILTQRSKVANESIINGVNTVAAEVSSLSQVKGFEDLANKAIRLKGGVDVILQSVQNVKAGVQLATAEGGNFFLGVRQAMFGVSASSNTVAKTLDFLGASFLSTSKAGDILTQSAQSISGQMGTFNKNMSLATVALKEIGKEEGVNASALNKLDQSVQDVGKQFTRLNDVVKGTGKITPTQLAQISNKSAQLLDQINALTQSGFVPLGTKTHTVLTNMQKELQNNVSAANVLTAQMNASVTATDKVGKASTRLGAAAKSMGSTVRDAFGRFKGDATSGGQAVDGIPPKLKNVQSELRRTTQEAGLFKTAFLGAFTGAIVGSIVSGIGRVFGSITAGIAHAKDQFVEINSLVQNFDLTLRQMLTGVSQPEIESALGNITDFIREQVARTPFEIADAFQAFQRLATAGLDPRKWLTPVADAASAVNKPMEQLIGAMQRLQAGAKGIGIDMLRDFGIPINQVGSFIDTTTGKTLSLNEVFNETTDLSKLSGDELAAMGVEFKKLEFDKQGSLIQNGSEALEILNGFLSQNTAFAGAAEARSRTLTGVLSNLRDVISILSIEAGKPIFKVITDAGSQLLAFIGVIQPSLERLAQVIGGGVANAFTYLSGSMGNFSGSTDAIIFAVDNLTAFLEAVFSGDWVTVWAVFSSVVDSAITSTFDFLNDFVTDAFDWGASFVEQIANGIIDTASSLLVEAMNYVGDIVASFMAPGSPPKEGPLSTIDTWGKGLMDTFTNSMANVDTSKIKGALGQVRNLFDKFDLGAAQADVLAIQQQIIDAEAAGFVPASLKKQLQLAQDKVELIQAQEQAQKELGKEAEKTLEKEKGGAVSDTGKGGGPSTGDRQAKDRVGKEKQTAVQVKDAALAILDQQLKDGVIKYEDYAKERLRIEEKFYQDTLEEGGTVAKQNIDNIKHYQSEVDRLAEEKKKKKGEDGTGIIPEIPSARDILAGFADEAGDEGTNIGEKIVTNLSDSISKNFGTVRNNLLNRLKGLGTQITDKIAEFFTPIQPPLVALTGGYEQVQTPFQAAITQISTFITFVQTNLPTIKAGFLSVWETVRASTVAAFTVISTAYNENLKPSFDQLTGALDSIGLSWGEVFGGILKATGFVVIGVIAVITGLVTAVITGASFMISGFQTIATGISQIITGIIQIFASLAFFVTNILQGNFVAAFSAFPVLLDGVLNVVKGIINNIIGIFTLLVGTVYGIVKGFIVGVVGFFTELDNQLVGESIIPDMVTDILLAITGMATNFLIAIAQMVVDAVAEFENMKDDWIEAGQSAIDGLVEGFQKNRDKVIDFLTGLAKEALAAIGISWATGSPSVKFRELGISAIQGLTEGINDEVPQFIDAIGAAADDAEEVLDSFIDNSKTELILKRLKDLYRAGFEEINALGSKQGSQILFEKLYKSMNLAALGIDEGQYGAITNAARTLIDKTFVYAEQQSEAFLSNQTNLFKNIQKSAADAMQPFNQQVFNIRKGATEARIELEKMFNRTVTDAEVAEYAKALEGVPLEQLSEQQRLFLRNYILQNKLTDATEQEARVREAMLKLGERGQAFQTILERMGLAEAPGAAQESGNQIIEALGLGIDAGLEDVLSSLGNVSDSIIAKIKTALGIASPSAVFMSFGEQLSAGLAQGIMNGIGGVGGALGNLMSPALALAGGGAQLNGGGFGGGTFAGGAPIQLIQYNTIGDEFDMAVFTARTQQAVVDILRTGR